MSGGERSRSGESKRASFSRSGKGLGVFEINGFVNFDFHVLAGGEFMTWRFRKGSGSHSCSVLQGRGLLDE